VIQPLRPSAEFRQIMRKLRACGFFTAPEEATDSLLVASWRRQCRDEYEFSELRELVCDPPEDYGRRLREIAMRDRRRVWYSDLEADVCASNQVYKLFTEDMAVMFGPRFQPMHIRETWRGEQGPITLTFVDQGQTHTFTPEYQDDWMDIELFPFFARLFRRKGFADNIWVEATDRYQGQDLYLVRASPAELRKMQRVLGWQFEKI
jgi:hypothetical protein